MPPTRLPKWQRQVLSVIRSWLSVLNSYSGCLPYAWADFFLGMHSFLFWRKVTSQITSLNLEETCAFWCLVSCTFIIWIGAFFQFCLQLTLPKDILPFATFGCTAWDTIVSINAPFSSSFSLSYSCYHWLYTCEKEFSKVREPLQEIFEAFTSPPTFLPSSLLKVCLTPYELIFLVEMWFCGGGFGSLPPYFCNFALLGGDYRPWLFTFIFLRHFLVMPFPSEENHRRVCLCSLSFTILSFIFCSCT